MPVRVRLLVVILLLIGIGGIASLKFFQTTRGRAMLLDFGVFDNYALVQQEIDAALREALAEQGLEAGMQERTMLATVGEHRIRYRSWDVTCPGECSFVDINVAVTRAVRDAGGVVRSGTETGSRTEPAQLLFTVGSRSYTTHRVLVHRAPTAARETGPHTATGRAKLALVIDDFGYSRQRVERFLALDLPLTIAVIPSLPNTGYAISLAKQRKREAMLHLPMEAVEFQSDVTPIGTTMADDEIDSLLARYLGGTRGVTGVNNHLGSLATQDERVMSRVIRAVKAQELYFLDSLTSKKSIAYNTAKRMGVPAARNDLFLDDGTEDDVVVEERLLHLIDIARKNGQAIGIGHPQPWTYEALKRNERLLKESGVELVFVSDLIE